MGGEIRKGIGHPFISKSLHTISCGLGNYYKTTDISIKNQQSQAPIICRFLQRIGGADHNSMAEISNRNLAKSPPH
jgi:hypothetical protein